SIARGLYPKRVSPYGRPPFECKPEPHGHGALYPVELVAPPPHRVRETVMTSPTTIRVRS
ncbi:MAG: hypothetical protein J7450_10425, partial [Thermomicrobium sp.]|uniref:hypothetical protein n=1 Tax=Thermomicrobium sp. TaxID=1969469 RepID=UPI001B163A09